jgi:hypothetical protein
VKSVPRTTLLTHRNHLATKVIDYDGLGEFHAVLIEVVGDSGSVTSPDAELALAQESGKQPNFP